MITREQIRSLLTGNGSNPISALDAEQMEADFPYFTVPQLLYLKYTPDAMPDDRRIQQVLVHVAPHQHLESVLGIDDESFADLYPQAPSTDNTLQAIDQFLDIYRRGSRRSEEEELERLISGSIIAQSDYMSTFLSEEEATPLFPAKGKKQEKEILPTFTKVQKLSKEEERESKQPEKPAQTTVESSNDDTFFTESLAKIYIKQRRYEKALEIIKKLSLKYPEKNIYFADQIRFLEKLIINNKTE